MSHGLTLGLDTTGRIGSVALHGPDFSDEEVFTKGVIHGVALAPAVEALFARAGAKPADLDLVAVGIGPGSYTGVRVGVSFAKSLAFATGADVVGVSSLDAMAENGAAGGEIACVRDARRGTAYLGVYRPGADGPEREGDVRLVRLEDLQRLLPERALVLGDAIERFPDSLSGGGRTLADPPLWESSALAVARLGLRRATASGPDDVHELAPVYLRPSEAEERLDREGGEVR